MPPSTPPVIAPYLQECLSEPSQTLLTSVLDASTTWLVLRFIAATLFGIDDENKKSRTSRDGSSTSSEQTVTLISLIRPQELWVEMGRKMGVDLASFITAKRLAYIDGLSCGYGTSPADHPNTIRPKSHTLREIGNSVAMAKQNLSTASGSHTKHVVIIDGIDYILASQPDVSPLQLTQYLTSLHDQFSHVVLTLSADSALLHNVEPSATPLELDHSMFLRTVAHQSKWVMQLRPLETGHAKDVSGVIRVSKGGSHGEEGEVLPDGEWLYQVKGDGSVRVWGRGE